MSLIKKGSKASLTFGGIFPTLSALSALNDVTEGTFFVVEHDESRKGNRSFYVYSKDKTFHFLGDLSDYVDPLPFVQEKIKEVVDSFDVKFIDFGNQVNKTTSEIAKNVEDLAKKIAEIPVYVHPDTHPASIIQETTDKQFVSRSDKERWDKAAANTGGVGNDHICENPNHITKKQAAVLALIL